MRCAQAAFSRDGSRYGRNAIKSTLSLGLEASPAAPISAPPAAGVDRNGLRRGV